jgi:uncharacterized membrane protein YfcA
MTLTPLIIVSLATLGVVVGVISGVIGIGGGIMVIPALIFLYGFSQQKANGTSLAMLLPPIGVFAVLAYQKAGNVHWPAAMLLAGGFLIGAWMGGILVNSGKVPEETLRILFAFLLLYIAIRMIVQSDAQIHASYLTAIVFLATGISMLVLRLLGRRWQNMPSLPVVYREKLKEPLEHDYEI